MEIRPSECCLWDFGRLGRWSRTHLTVWIFGGDQRIFNGRANEGLKHPAKVPLVIKVWDALS